MENFNNKINENFSPMQEIREIENNENKVEELKKENETLF